MRYEDIFIKMIKMIAITFTKHSIGGKLMRFIKISNLTRRVFTVKMQFSILLRQFLLYL